MNLSRSLPGDLTSRNGGTRGTLTDWAAVRASLESDGIALTPPLLDEAECREVRSWFDEPKRFRSTVVMGRYGFGRGTYRYFADPLPDLVRDLREELYPPLADIANAWAVMLKERQFPAGHSELAAECAAAGQAKPTPLILHYVPGDHCNLHQDLYGDIVFPLQVAIMLSKPGEEFEGGEASSSSSGRGRSPGPSSPGRPRGRGSFSRCATAPYSAVTGTGATQCATGRAISRGASAPCSASSSTTPAEPGAHAVRALTHPSRLEGLSDATFAIVLTLLVREADDTVERRISGAYRWLLVPAQSVGAPLGLE